MNNTLVIARHEIQSTALTDKEQQCDTQVLENNWILSNID